MTNEGTQRIATTILSKQNGWFKIYIILLPFESLKSNNGFVAAQNAMGRHFKMTHKDLYVAENKTCGKPLSFLG